ncbi:hypothetical protein AGMMS50230_23000 [Spirochaetia bacterium]|nr:hypothetical protein AGMMS50230_23000 [Spirochaetia bacterium]
MRLSTFLLLPLLFFGALFVLSAQEEDDDEIIPIESDWSGSTAATYRRGDRIFSIALGLVKPLFFYDQELGYLGLKSGGYDSPRMSMGGTGILGFNYFLGPHLFLGLELGGMFAPTVGKSMYYIVPLGARIGYQFVYKRFEFPLTFMLGFAPQSHHQRSYLGLFAKPSAAAYFRFNADWSFGFNTGLWWVPQWTSVSDDKHTGKIRIHGFFWEFSIGARYHF